MRLPLLIIILFGLFVDSDAFLFGLLGKRRRRANRARRIANSVKNKTEYNNTGNRQEL